MHTGPFIRLKLLVIFLSEKTGGCSEEMEIYSLFGRRVFNLFSLFGRRACSIYGCQHPSWLCKHTGPPAPKSFSSAATFISTIVKIKRHHYRWKHLDHNPCWSYGCYVQSNSRHVCRVFCLSPGHPVLWDRTGTRRRPSSRRLPRMPPRLLSQSSTRQSLWSLWSMNDVTIVNLTGGDGGGRRGERSCRRPLLRNPPRPA